MAITVTISLPDGSTRSTLAADGAAIEVGPGALVALAGIDPSLLAITPSGLDLIVGLPSGESLWLLGFLDEAALGGDAPGGIVDASGVLVAAVNELAAPPGTDEGPGTDDEPGTDDGSDTDDRPGGTDGGTDGARAGGSSRAVQEAETGTPLRAEPSASGPSGPADGRSGLSNTGDGQGPGGVPGAGRGEPGAEGTDPNLISMMTGGGPAPLAKPRQEPQKEPPVQEVAPDPLPPIELAGFEGGFVINGVGADDRSGRSVSDAGDVNGDGLDDVIVGAFNADANGNLRSGESFVVFGKLDDTTVELSDIQAGAGGFVINGVALNDRSGLSVSSAGDVNGDGLSDLIVGAPNSAAGGFLAGASYVVFGKAGGAPVELSEISMDADPGGFLIGGAGAGDELGISVSAAGDVNGDGLDDVIVGAWFADANGIPNSGASYVVFGKADGLSVDISAVAASGNDSGFIITGDTGNGRAGSSVSGAGDVNGDGLADLIVGVRGGETAQGRSGLAMVVFGKADGAAVDLAAIGPAAEPGGFLIEGAGPSDLAGWSVSTAGDVNGDGLDDLIVGAVSATPNGPGSGSSYVVFGKADGTAASLLDVEAGIGGFVIEGDAAFDYSGWSVSTAGDVNGDGLDDLIVGAPYDGPNEPWSGSAFVVFGKADTEAVPLSAIESGYGGFQIMGAGINQRAGLSVSGAGDVNGDGFDDLIVGASYASPNGSISGASYVIFGGDFTGSVDLLGGAGGQTLTGASGADVINGGAGNGTIVGNGGADVIKAGGGDDRIEVPDAGFFRIDGGAGDDVLAFTAAVTLDFDSLERAAIRDVEVLDFENETGGDVVTLALADVLSLNVRQDDVLGSGLDNTLFVRGDAGDTLALVGGFGAVGGAPAGFQLYETGDVRVAVDTDFDLTLVP